jgi:hypothetical protein
MCNAQNFVQQDFSLFPCRELLIPTTQKERKQNSQLFLLGSPNRTPVLSVKCGGLGKRSFRLGEEKRQPLLSANEIVGERGWVSGREKERHMNRDLPRAL